MAKAAAKGMIHILAIIAVIIIVGGLAFMAYRQREGNSQQEIPYWALPMSVRRKQWKTADAACKKKCKADWPDQLHNCYNCCFYGMGPSADGEWSCNYLT